MFLKKFQENFTFPTYFVITCLCIFCITIKINARILRKSCFSYGDFNYIKNNEALQGTSIASFRELTVEACQDQCIFNPHCKSFNIHGNGTCHLFKVSAADPTDESTMISKQGWTYISTSYSDRLVGINCRELDPCGENYLCEDTCQCPGFECISCDMVPDKCIDNLPSIYFSIKHTDGLCVSVHLDRVNLTQSCNDLFTLTEENAFKHVKSEKCLMPESAVVYGASARIVLTPNCSDPYTRFEHTDQLSLKHISTGKCVHTQKVIFNSSHGTELVIHETCDKPQLQFNLIKDDRRL